MCCRLPWTFCQSSNKLLYKEVIPTLRCGNWSKERLRKLPKAVRVMSSRAGKQTWSRPDSKAVHTQGNPSDPPSQRPGKRSEREAADRVQDGASPHQASEAAGWRGSWATGAGTGKCQPSDVPHLLPAGCSFFWSDPRRSPGGTSDYCPGDRSPVQHKQVCCELPDWLQ